MPRLKLTEQAIKRLSVSEGQVDYQDTDAGKGVELLLRVSAGGTKTWCLRYRLRDGRRRRFKLGRFVEARQSAYGRAFDPEKVEPGNLPLSLSEARAVARVQKGRRDPQGDKEAQRSKATPRVRDLADRFMREHAAKRSDSTRRNYRLLWDRHLLPCLGPKPVAEVTWSDVDRLHQRMRETPIIANRMLSLVSKAWGLAQRWKWYPPDLANPGKNHDRYPEERVGRALTSDELKRLGEALEREPEGDARVAVVRLLVLCGARPSEIRTARWADVSPDCREIDLKRAKTGRRSIYLGEPAAAILATRLREGEHVFANPETGQPYADLKPIERRLKGAAKLDSRPYDWYRHTFTTVALEAGVPLERVKRLTGHSIPDITAGVYGHIRREVLLQDADRVAGQIEAALRGDGRASVSA